MKVFLLTALVMTALVGYDVSGIPEISRSSFEAQGGRLACINFTEASTGEDGVVFSISIPATYQGKAFRQVMYAADRNDILSSCMELGAGTNAFEFQVKVKNKSLDKPVLILVCGADLAAIRANKDTIFGYFDFKKLTSMK